MKLLPKAHTSSRIRVFPREYEDGIRMMKVQTTYNNIPYQYAEIRNFECTNVLLNKGVSLSLLLSTSISVCNVLLMHCAEPCNLLIALARKQYDP